MKNKNGKGKFIKKIESYKIGFFVERCEIRNQLRDQGCPEEHLSEIADNFYNKDYEIAFSVGEFKLENFRLIME